MEKFISGFTKELGNSLGAVIIKIIVLVVLTILVLLVTGVVFGLLFGWLAFIFYRRRKKIKFLIFGLLGSLFSSLGISMVFGLFMGFENPVKLAVILFPVFLALGVFFVVSKYKQLVKGK